MQTFHCRPSTTFSAFNFYARSLPSFEEIPGYEELLKRKTERIPFEGATPIVSVPVPVVVTAPRLIFPSKMELVYTSHKEEDIEVQRTWLQEHIKTFIETDNFQALVGLVIFINCLALSFGEPSDDVVAHYLALVDISCSIFFGIEAVLAIYALTPSVYLSSRWRQLDVVVAGEGVWTVYGHFTGQEGFSLVWLRCLRVLRPLRTISRVPELQDAVEVLLKALPAIGNAMVLYVVFTVFAAVFFLQLAVHSLEYSCTGPDFDDLEEVVFCSPEYISCIPGLFVPNDCNGDRSACKPLRDPLLYPNFEHFGNALLTSFRISMLDGWSYALWHMQNALGPNIVALFIILIIIGPSIITNLCIAAILKHYGKAQTERKEKLELENAIQDKMKSGDTLATQCACGNTFMGDSRFCRKCGAVRLNKDGTIPEDQESVSTMSENGGASDDEGDGPRWVCAPPREVTQCFTDRFELICGFHYGGVKDEYWRKMADDDFSLLNKFMTLCICTNVIFMASESYGMPTEQKNNISTANVCFTIIFLVETAFKLFVLGPGDYLEYGRSPANVTDFIVVILSTAALFEDSFASASVLRICRFGRATRVLRMGKVSARMQQIVQVLDLMKKSIVRIWPMLFLLLLFLFMATILGMRLVGDIPREENNGFRTFGQAFTMTLFVMCLEDWGDILEFAAGNGPYALYFVGVVLLGQLLLLNLVLATIVDGAFDIFDDEFERQEKLELAKKHLKRAQLKTAFYHFMFQTQQVVTKPPRLLKESEPALATRMQTKPNDKLTGSLVAETPMVLSTPMEDDDSVDRKNANLLTKVLSVKSIWKKKLNQDDGASEDSNDEQNSPQNSPNSGRPQLSRRESLQGRQLQRMASSKGNRANEIIVFSPKKNYSSGFDDREADGGLKYIPDWLDAILVPLIGLCMDIDESPKFNRLMDVALFLSCFTIFSTTSFFHPETHCFVVSAWTIVDSVCVWIFVLENLVRGGARGFWYGTQPLLRDSWMKLEIAINVSGVMAFTMASMCVLPGWFSLFIGIMRSLRPLRVVNRIENLHRAFTSIVLSLKGLSSLLLVILLLKCAFAIMGMQLYMGLFWHCEDEGFPEGMSRYGEKAEDGSYIQEPCKSWVNADFNYDNFASAMISTFTFSAGGWSALWLSAVNSNELEHNLIYYNNFAFIPMFFACIFVFDFFLKNMFIGVLFESYIRLSSTSDDGSLLSNQTRRFQYFKNARKSVFKPLTEDPVLLEEAAASKCVKLTEFIEGELHAKLMFGVLTFNLLLLCLSSNSQELWITIFLDAGNTVITFLFVIDFFMCICAYGLKLYLRDLSNQFDTLVTFTSAFDTGLELASGFATASCPSLALLRSMRVVRLLRLLHYFPATKVFIEATLMALPAIRDLVSLLFILMLIMGSIGYTIFKDRYDSGTDKGIFTPNWKQYSNFNSVSNALEELLILATGDKWEDEMIELADAGHSSGRWKAYFFSIAFQVMAQFIFLNLFIMIIVESYEVLDDEARETADECIENFRRAWVKVDRDGTGEIPVEKMEELFLNLEYPIGCKGSSSSLILESKKIVLTRNKDFEPTFAWMLDELLRLYVYVDKEHEERVDKALKEAAIHVCKPAFKRVLKRAREVLEERRIEEERAHMPPPPPKTILDNIFDVFTPANVSRVSDVDDRETGVSEISDTASNFSELISCGRVDGVTVVHGEAPTDYDDDVRHDNGAFLACGRVDSITHVRSESERPAEYDGDEYKYEVADDGSI
jgi:hypothetical protein